MKKRLIGRRVFAAILAAAVSVSGIPVTSLAAGEAKAVEEGLIASFDFDSEEDGFIGAGAKAVVNGTAILEDSYEGVGKALAVSESTWLSVYRDDDGAVLEDWNPLPSPMTARPRIRRMGGPFTRLRI